VTFRGLPPEEHTFDALRITTRAVPVAGSTIEATIRLPLVAEVRGIVVDAGGTPVAGAVIAGEVGFVPQSIATAGADGRFRIRLAAAGRIWATKEGHGSSRMHQVDADVPLLELQLRAAGGSVAGIVLDPDGRVVPHAAVSIATDLEVGHGHPATPPVMLTADARGEFATTEVQRKRLIVFASAAGFAFGRQDVDASAADRVSVTVRLRRPATIHGVLLGGDTRNEPQVGTLVEASRESLLPGLLHGTSGRLTRMFTLSDAAGRYRLTGVPPGRVSMTTFDARRAPIHHSALLQEGQDYEWSPLLSPPSGVIRGTLLGPDGRGLAGMHLQATRFDPVQVREETSRTETDAHGQFELRELRPFPHSLMVGSTVQSEPFAKRTEVQPDGAPLVWRLAGLPSQSGSIVGRLLDPDGRPVIDAQYRVISEGITRRSTATPDRVGAFRIEDLVPGSWRVFGDVSGYGSFDLGQHAVGAHAQVDIGSHVLPRRGIVLTRVRGRDFEPTGIELTLEPVDGGKNRTSEFRPEGGALRSAPLPPGRYRLLARGANFAPVRREVEVGADAEVAIDLDVETGTTVTIEFVPEAHEEQEWRDCVIFEIRDQRGEVVLSKNLETREPTATFTLGLAPGAYTIEAMARLTTSREGKVGFIVPTTPTRTLSLRVLLEVLRD
jgi:hypothetical protein